MNNRKEKKLYYSMHRRNFGDALNPYLMERILNIPVKRVPYREAEMIGIGSLLQRYTVHKYNLPDRISAMFHSPVQVMSSGFIRAIPDNHVLNRHLEIKAVRGYESLKIVEQLTERPCNAAVGDGGLLYPWLLEHKVNKKYLLGIIPHYRDQQEAGIRQISERFNNVTVINVLDEPLDVLQKIAECELILSSSLHGLIIADAMGVPNRHLLLSNNINGQGFKYKDYYSIFAPETVLPAISTAEIQNCSIEEIFGSYQAQTARISTLQNDLLKAMKI